MTTPRYEFSKKIMAENLRWIKRHLGASIFYSLKCNSSPVVLQALSELDCGFEISSRSELDALLSIGIGADRIICGQMIKKCEFIIELKERQINYYVFDDMREYEKLLVHVPEAKKILRIYVKDLDSYCIGFGMEPDLIDRNLGSMTSLDGLSFHISNNTNIETVIKALDRVESILRRVPIASPPFILNIGGSYEISEELLPFYKTVGERLSALRRLYPLTVYAEPGAAIVNNAGRVITEVIMVKEHKGYTDVYLDAGIPIGVMRPPGSIALQNHSLRHPRRKFYRFFDTTSLHRVLFQGKYDWIIRDKDILELNDYGAYTLCYRNDFHKWEKPQERLWE